MVEAARPRRRFQSWSDIPLELADMVFSRLSGHVDLVRFAAVCPQWRAAARQVRLPPPLPLLALGDGTAYSLPETKPFHFPRCANYTEACGGNWLVFRDRDTWRLRDPFSNATVTLPAPSRVRVRYFYDETGRTWIEHGDTEGFTLRKVLFCSPNLVAALGIMESGKSQIAVCQPGANSWWLVRMDGQSHWFLDMAFYQGQLYALDYKGLIAIDIKVNQSTGDPWISKMEWVIGAFHGGFNVLLTNMVYLVEAYGALLIVCRQEPIPTDYDEMPHTVINVFKANFKESAWTKVTSIGDDQVLFLGRRCSRSVCVSQREMPGDCIVFIENDDEDSYRNNDKEISSVSVYNMKDGKVSTLMPIVSGERGRPATWLFFP